MAGHDWMDKDFYKVLGVKKDASASEIKKAYRSLARKLHPDKNPGDKKAESRFKEVGEAYNVLSDPEQRKQYDAIRAMAGGGARFSAGPGGAGAGFEDVFGSMFGGSGNGHRVRFSTSGGAGGGLDDILSGIFNGGGGAGRGGFGGFGQHAYQDYQSPSKGADLAASTTISLRQAVQGATLKMTVEGRSLTVRVPAGVNDGQKIRIRGKGRPGVNGGASGDLVVAIGVRKDPVFSLSGKNLHMKLPVSYPEAVLGSKVEVPLLDGSTVTVKVPPGTSGGTHLRVRRRGVDDGKRRGDLIIEVEIAVPSVTSKAFKDSVRKLSEATQGWDPRADLNAHVWQS
ncbi:DnaJ C-terminal domain-containing protein [Gleimia hominis]|uniref:DnaJ C-terminal domain-containing protein n=1 Tax=Gleimia hominis TaxID=595468 RepID=A0ABU3I9F8_9ACTO|nr:DnaJ C-terminal domain-containing protein [Gleimia hominis]MDT3767007.1 DnaJ C-terminal domain-containing protein [Gleimia hominis]